MAIDVPTSWPHVGTAGPMVQDEPVLEGHVEALAGCEARHRSRLRVVWSMHTEVTETGATLVSKALGQFYASANHADEITVRAQLTNARLQVIISDGSTTANAILTVAGAGPTWADDVIDVSALSGTEWSVEAKLRADPVPLGTLHALQLLESTQTSGTIR